MRRKATIWTRGKEGLGNTTPEAVRLGVGLTLKKGPSARQREREKKKWGSFCVGLWYPIHGGCVTYRFDWLRIKKFFHHFLYHYFHLKKKALIIIIIIDPVCLWSFWLFKMVKIVILLNIYSHSNTFKMLTQLQ